MRLLWTPRALGEVPIGGLAALPLTLLPFGAWMLEHGHFKLGTCGLKLAFGLPCLSCGSTRATIKLLHGDLAAAIAFQPLTIFVYALLVVWGGFSLYAFATRRSVHLDLSPRQTLAAKLSILVLPLVNWVYLVTAGI